jgi:hypothetical protein
MEYNILGEKEKLCMCVCLEGESFDFGSQILLTHLEAQIQAGYYNICYYYHQEIQHLQAASKPSLHRDFL